MKPQDSQEDRLEENIDRSEAPPEPKEREDQSADGRKNGRDEELKKLLQRNMLF